MALSPRSCWLLAGLVLAAGTGFVEWLLRSIIDGESSSRVVVVMDRAMDPSPPEKDSKATPVQTDGSRLVEKVPIAPDDFVGRLAQLAERTRPYLPTAAEVLAPATDREKAMAEMDLDRTLEMLWRNRFSPEEAKRHADALRILAAAGDSEIRLQLAKLLMTGRVEPISPEEAVELALQEAEAGNAEAALLVGQALEAGNGIETDYALAREWYLFAADAGYPDGWAELGMMEAMGFGGPIDADAAVDAFTRAWEAGSALGARRLGIAYLEGWGVEADVETGRAWLEAAGEAGDADAWYALAYAEIEGVFGTYDRERREEYLLNAAQLGNLRAAASIMPRLIRTGDDWAQEGIDLLSGAAQEGAERALIGLAKTLVESSGAARLGDAEALLQRAWELGSDEALYELVKMNANVPHFLLSDPRQPIDLLRQIGEDSSYYSRAQLMLSEIERGRAQTLAINEISLLSDAEVYVRRANLPPDPLADSVGKAGEVSDPSQLSEPLRIAKMVIPEYPPSLLSENLSGTVRVSMIVDSDGSVRPGSIEILKSFHPAFDQSVLDAVPQWRFHPGRKDGEAVACRVNINIPFSVKE